MDDAVSSQLLRNCAWVTEGTLLPANSDNYTRVSTRQGVPGPLQGVRLPHGPKLYLHGMGRVESIGQVLISTF